MRALAAAAALLAAAVLASGAQAAPREVPVIRQALRNNCETAALAMVLAWHGRPVDQLELQRRLPRSGPLDPTAPPALPGTPDAELPLWGDPDSGFVGRAAGGGLAGGFGVYQGPVRRLARRYGVRLDDLSRRPPRELYARLRARRPVIAWIALSEGPYRRWRAPSGRPVSVNFGEHTVVLVAASAGSVEVNDPLVGIRRTLSKRDFEARWALLGRRALGA